MPGKRILTDKQIAVRIRAANDKKKRELDEKSKALEDADSDDFSTGRADFNYTVHTLRVPGE